MARKIEKLFFNTTNLIGGRFRRFGGISWQSNKKKTIASLHGVSSSNWRNPKRVWLRIDPTQWKKLNQKEREGIIKHEALHTRFPRHDTYFRYYAKKYNIPLSGSEVKGLGYQLFGQPQKGRKFIPIKTNSFKSYEDAKNYLMQNKELQKSWRAFQIKG